MDQLVPPQPPSGPPAELLEPLDTRTVPWRAGDLFLAFLTGIALSVVLMIPIVVIAGVAEGEMTFAAVGAMGIAIYISLCITGWFFAVKRRGASLRDAGFRPVTAGTLLKMLPVTIGMMMLTGLVVSLSSLLFGDVPTAQDQVVGGADSIALADFIWLFVLGAIAAPIAEEFLFRGLLYPLLRNRSSVAVAVGVSAFAFAFVHFLPPLIPALLVMGVVLALLMERFKSLYPSIVVHALNNAVALLALYAAIGTG